jgi:hypothetical protein
MPERSFLRGSHRPETSSMHPLWAAHAESTTWLRLQQPPLSVPPPLPFRKHRRPSPQHITSRYKVYQTDVFSHSDPLPNVPGPRVTMHSNHTTAPRVDIQTSDSRPLTSSCRKPHLTRQMFPSPSRSGSRRKQEDPRNIRKQGFPSE